MIALIFACLLLNSLVISAPSSSKSSKPDPSTPAQLLGPKKYVQTTPLGTQSVVISTLAPVLDVANVIKMATKIDLAPNSLDNVHTDISTIAAVLSPDVLNKLLTSFKTSDLTIEPNFAVEIADRGGFNSNGRESNCPSWGKLRIASQALPTAGATTFTFENCRGPRINVWILDTGLNANHPNFEGRAKNIANTIDPSKPADDDNGHGTMVAGMCGAKVYGAYRNMNLYGIKCIDQYGIGYLSSILAGLNEVAKRAKALNRGGGVSDLVNMSLTGPYSDVLNSAAAKLVKESNVAVFVAAGNYGAPADFFSPASSPDVCTVSTTDPSDSRPWFANWGPFVDIHAPGVSVITTTIGSGAPVTFASGTSLSTPLVVGVAASFCNCRRYRTPYELYDELNSSATKGAIPNIDPYTVNTILYNKLSSRGRGHRDDDDNDDQNEDYRDHDDDDDDDDYHHGHGRGGH